MMMGEIEFLVPLRLVVAVVLSEPGSARLGTMCECVCVCACVHA